MDADSAARAIARDVVREGVLEEELIARIAKYYIEGYLQRGAFREICRSVVSSEDVDPRGAVRKAGSLSNNELHQLLRDLASSDGGSNPRSASMTLPNKWTDREDAGSKWARNYSASRAAEVHRHGLYDEDLYANLKEDISSLYPEAVQFESALPFDETLNFCAAANECTPTTASSSGKWEDDHVRMVFVSWIPQQLRATIGEKRKAEVHLKKLLRNEMSVTGLAKVLLFPPKGTHCKLVFDTAKDAALFIEKYGGPFGSPQSEKWKEEICLACHIPFGSQFNGTSVTVEWAQVPQLR